METDILLNIDYKTKILSNRLLKVIINDDQMGYIMGWYIGFNIKKLEDIMQYVQINNSPGIILNIDFEKTLAAHTTP